MFFRPVHLKVNYTKPEYAIADTQAPVFSWGAEHEMSGSRQSAYRLMVFSDTSQLWDSGFVNSDKQQTIYGGNPLPSGTVLNWSIQLKDTQGNVSQIETSSFTTACFEPLQGMWIASPLERDHEVWYFRKCFLLEEQPISAVLYHCGLGISKPYLNTQEIDKNYLQPDFTNYPKECRYRTSPLSPSLFVSGKNTLEIAVAGGWRKNYGSYLDNMSSDRKIEFMGNLCLWAMLVLTFKNGKQMVFSTDESWECSDGPVTYAHLFHGETYDARLSKVHWIPAIVSAFQTENLHASALEPILVKKELLPQNSYFLNGRYIYDFGENFSGVIRLHAKGNAQNTRFILRHAEELSESGDLFTDTLRSAEAADTYICGDGYCDFIFTPQFTYHGFRYASLEITGNFSGTFELCGLSFYTDIDTKGFFKCGNPLVNELYQTYLRTERANLHSIATDCPQRDERMAWMNDATVRFMTMPYHFEITKLFEKIAEDIANEQDFLGRLTDTAPFLYGEQPADPVCQAYLIAVYMHYQMTGTTFLIAKHYDNLKHWNQFLKTQAEDGIIHYSYYGDWAGPADCCYREETIGNSDLKKPEEYDPGAANSLYIPGEMSSTVMYYLNLKLMMEFARLLEKENDISDYQAEAARVQTAYLEKWLDKSTFTIHNNTAGVYALSLYVGIIPLKYEIMFAEKMVQAVISDNYRLKCANLVTPMLFDMLSKYGYTEIAWNMLTSQEYPSLGFMLANGATTFWERFELKKESGMNSHNHPMYGAVIGWLYRHLAGFKVVTPNKCYELSPQFPKDLLYFEISIPALAGNIYFKCEKKYYQTYYSINVPFGMSVDLKLSNTSYVLEHGFHSIALTE